MPATLQGRITIDPSPAEAGLRRFESSARGHVSRLDRIFAKTPGPERRLERFAGGIATGLTGVTSGPGALVGMLGGIGRGLGLAGGAAAGLTVAAETLLKIREREQETKKHTKELNDELRKVEHAARWELPAEGVDKLSASLQASRKSARNLRDEVGQYSFSRHPFLNIGKQIGSFFGLAESPDERRSGMQERLSKNASAQGKTRATILQSLKDELALITEETSGSESTAKWESKRLQYQKELTELRKKGFKDSELGDFTKRYQTEKAAFDEQARHERMQSGVTQAAEYRANVGSGITPAAQNIANLRDQLKEVNRQRAQPQSEEARAKLEEERTKIQNQIDKANLEGSRTSPEDRRQQEMQAIRDKTDMSTLRNNRGLTNVHRDMSGRVIGGTDPVTGKHVDTPAMESGGNSMSWELSRHMPAADHMNPFGGSKKFNDFFHPQNQPATKQDMHEVMDHFWGDQDY